jgi:hypothetical protein
MGASLRRAWKVLCTFAKQHPDTVTAFIAVIIAAFSLYVTVNQVKESRKQTDIMIKQFETMNVQTKETIKQRDEMRNYSRKMTRPHLYLLCTMDVLKGGKIGIFIKNSGMGPAIIRLVLLEVNGKIYDGSDTKSFSEALEAMGLRTTQKYVLHYNVFRDGTQVYQGQLEDFITLYLTKNITNKVTINDYEKAMSQLTIRIISESLDGEPMFITYKYLDDCK